MEERMRFHCFPSDKERFLLWLQFIKVSSDLLVFSLAFNNGRKWPRRLFPWWNQQKSAMLVSREEQFIVSMNLKRIIHLLFLFKCIFVIDYSSEMLACPWPSGYDQSSINSFGRCKSNVAGNFICGRWFKTQVDTEVTQSNLLNQFINAVCI